MLSAIADVVLRSVPLLSVTGMNCWRLLPICLSPSFSLGNLLSNLPIDAVETPACRDAKPTYTGRVLY